MSQENVEVIAEIVAAWNTGGVEAILPFCPEDVVWHPFPEWPDGAEPRAGHDGVRELMNAWTDNFDEWTTVTKEVRDVGDRVLVLGEMVGLPAMRRGAICLLPGSSFVRLWRAR